MSVPLTRIEPPVGLLPVERAAAQAAQADGVEAHLRSTQAVNGYHLKTNDGTAGHIYDFLVNDESWEIAELVIKTGHRFTGKDQQSER